MTHHTMSSYILFLDCFYCMFFCLFIFTDGSTHGFVVHLHVVPECGSFKLNRFHISKNNVRKYWIEDKDTPVDTQCEYMFYAEIILYV